MRRERHGLVDNWLGHVHDVIEKHAAQVASIADEAKRLARVCELNVIEQVVNVAQTTVVRDAWQRGQSVTLHGWIYGIDNGLLRDLRMTAQTPEDVAALYRVSAAS